MNGFYDRGYVFQALRFVMDFVRVFDRSVQSLKKYKYGITIIAPSRQLKNTYGRADFLVDNKIINEKMLSICRWAI